MLRHIFRIQHFSLRVWLGRPHVLRVLELVTLEQFLVGRKEFEAESQDATRQSETPARPPAEW